MHTTRKKKQFIDALRLFEVYNIKIEHQKIKNWLGKIIDKVSKLISKNGYKLMISPKNIEYQKANNI